MNPTMSEDQLQSYVDGQLAPAELAAVEAYLQNHPEEADRLAIYRQQAKALRAAFAPILEETIPPKLRNAAIASPANEVPKVAQGSNSFSLQRLAAAVFLLVVGGMVGWLGHDLGHDHSQSPTTFATLPHQAAVAHVVFAPDMRRPVEVAADQEAQLVKWLSKRLDAPMRVPQLVEQGFALVGGRLLPGNRGPVAQLMYESANGTRMTLYVSREYAQPGETAFRFAQEGKLNVFYWVDANFGYALSGELDKAQLAQVSAAVYAQLSSQAEH